MKRILSLLAAFALMFSVIGFVSADTADPEPEFKRPVRIAAVDENGEPIEGVELQLSDADRVILEGRVSENGTMLFLKEGEYTLEGLSAPDGYYFDDEAVSLTVETTEAEQMSYMGLCRYDHEHEGICLNPNHIGMELYSIADGEDEIVAYCFNHMLKNPDNSSRYKKYPANAEDLFRYARNKSDDITADELYAHVLSIIYHSSDIQEKYGLDDAVIRFLTYGAIKSYTDPKCYYEFDADGNSLLVRDENNRPVRDENGKYVFAPGGTVIGAIIHHAAAEKMTFPQEYRDAYQELVNASGYPDDYHLYFYYPEGYQIESDRSYQILMTAEIVEEQQARLLVHPAMQFGVTLNWDDAADYDGLRPAPENVIDMLHLYADGEEVTDLYRDRIIVVDNGDGTYSVSLKNLPQADYTLSIDACFGYKVDADGIVNGDTVVLVHPIRLVIIPVKPFKPFRPGKPIRPTPIDPIIPGDHPIR